MLTVLTIYIDMYILIHVIMYVCMYYMHKCTNANCRGSQCWNQQVQMLYAHVLQETESTFEGNYTLVHTHLRYYVVGLKVVEGWLERTQFEERVVSRFSFLPVATAVIQMKEAKNQAEVVVSLHNLSTSNMDLMLHVHYQQWDQYRTHSNYVSL